MLGTVAAKVNLLLNKKGKIMYGANLEVMNFYSIDLQCNDFYLHQISNILISKLFLDLSQIKYFKYYGLLLSTTLCL